MKKALIAVVASVLFLSNTGCIVTDLVLAEVYNFGIEQVTSCVQNALTAALAAV